MRRSPWHFGQSFVIHAGLTPRPLQSGQTRVPSDGELRAAGLTSGCVPARLRGPLRSGARVGLAEPRDVFRFGQARVAVLDPAPQRGVERAERGERGRERVGRHGEHARAVPVLVEAAVRVRLTRDAARYRQLLGPELHDVGGDDRARRHE